MPPKKQDDIEQVDAEESPLVKRNSADEQETPTEVALPEEFQSQVTAIVQEATQPQLDFIMSLIREREKSMREDDFSTEEMPSED